jgi:hypothetical protein
VLDAVTSVSSEPYPAVNVSTTFVSARSASANCCAPRLSRSVGVSVASGVGSGGSSVGVSVSCGVAVDVLLVVGVRVGVAAGEGGGVRVGLVGCALFVSAIDVLALQPASKPMR